MKKILFILAICAVFVGCNKSDFEKVKFNNKDISGYWVLVDRSDNYYMSEHYANIGDVILFDGDKIHLFCPNSQDILDYLEMGYYNCTIEDFTLKESFTFEIMDDCFLYVKGDYDWLDGEMSLNKDTLIVGDDIYDRLNEL